MKMQALVALQNLTYASRNIKAGHTFTASPKDARILVAIRRAQIDPAVDPATVKQVDVQELPEVDVLTDAVGMKEPHGKEKKRSYVRRAPTGPGASYAFNSVSKTSPFDEN